MSAKRMPLTEIKELARKACAEQLEQYFTANPEDRSKLTFSSVINGKESIECVFYLPAPKHTDGQVIARTFINPLTGAVIMKREDPEGFNTVYDSFMHDGRQFEVRTKLDDVKEAVLLRVYLVDGQRADRMTYTVSADETESWFGNTNAVAANQEAIAFLAHTAKQSIMKRRGPKKNPEAS